MSLEFILKILKYERSLFQNTKEKWVSKMSAGHTANYFITVCLLHSCTKNRNREGKVLGKG